MSLGSDFVCVVQLTDSHLFADAEGDLLGLQTQASLDAVVDMVLEQISRMDLVLATGDITQDGSEAAYRRFIASSLRLPAPCYWIPGNHDDAELMARLTALDGGKAEAEGFRQGGGAASASPHTLGRAQNDSARPRCRRALWHLLGRSARLRD